MKKILITGAAGFIGFHLALFLQKRGDFIIGLDNFNNYYSTELKRSREKILADYGICIIEEDLQNTTLLKELLKKYDITHIVHLAAQAGVRHSFSHPQDYISSNISGFLSLLEACRYYPNIPVIYASSSSVYGLNEKLPFDLNDSTDRPANFYGVTKKTNELMAHAYHNLYGIPLTGLRYFTVYGPWGRPDMAYYSFTKKIINEEEISLFNQGDMERDFTYVDDIVKGTAAALDLSSNFDIFNLGNNRAESLKDFISILESLIGKKAIIKKLDMPSGEIKKTHADISLSQKKLLFSPSTSLKKGLTNFVQWYLQYHSDCIA